jgi:hypothetical protein
MKFTKRIILISVFLLFGCGVTVKQFYPDTFYREDQVYENKPLRFLLTFSGNWHLFTDPEEMDRDSRLHALELNKSGIELLFIGSTVEGLYGTRGIAVNLNEPGSEYAEYIHRINKDDITNDKGLVQFVAGKNSMVKWVYDKSEFRFVEFFFNIGTYDLRIAFWTRLALFEKFLPVFEEIMSTLTIINGM